MANDFTSYTLFNQLFDNTKDRLWSFVRNHVKNQQDAEDIIQHCYIKLWENIEQVDAERVDRLLFTYSRNAVIDNARKKQRSILQPLVAGTEEISCTNETSPENVLVHKELKAEVGAIISRLPAKRRQIFTMVRVQGMSYDEVSLQLGISKLTIKEHMHEALRFVWEEGGELYAPFLLLIAGIGVCK